MFAPTYLAGIVVVLVQVLNFLGIEVGSEALTTTLETLFTVGAGLFVLYRQISTGRSTIAGTRPE